MERLRNTFAAFLLSLLLVPVGATASAVDTTDTPTPEAIVQAELMRALTSDSAEVQERAAQRIRAYAHFDRYNEAVLSDLVKPLHDIVATGETERLRLVAISALSAIGTDAAMEGLKAQADSFDSPRLAQMTETVLTQYETDRSDLRRSRVGE